MKIKLVFLGILITLMIGLSAASVSADTDLTKYSQLCSDLAYDQQACEMSIYCSPHPETTCVLTNLPGPIAEDPGCEYASTTTTTSALTEGLNLDMYAVSEPHDTITSSDLPIFLSVSGSDCTDCDLREGLYAENSCVGYESEARTFTIDGIEWRVESTLIDYDTAIFEVSSEGETEFTRPLAEGESDIVLDLRICLDEILEMEEGEYLAGRDSTQVCLKYIAPEPLAEQACEAKGCLLDGNCVAQGMRATREDKKAYCGIDSDWHSQKDTRKDCDNNYECKSNFCSNSKCHDVVGIINRILSYFERIEFPRLR